MTTPLEKARAVLADDGATAGELAGALTDLIAEHEHYSRGAIAEVERVQSLYQRALNDLGIPHGYQDAPPTDEHHYPDGSYDVDWATPPANDERDALVEEAIRRYAIPAPVDYATTADYTFQVVFVQGRRQGFIDAGFRRQEPVTDAHVDAAYEVLRGIAPRDYVRRALEAARTAS